MNLPHLRPAFLMEPLARCTKTFRIHLPSSPWHAYIRSASSRNLSSISSLPECFFEANCVKTVFATRLITCKMQRTRLHCPGHDGTRSTKLSIMASTLDALSPVIASSCGDNGKPHEVSATIKYSLYL